MKCIDTQSFRQSPTAHACAGLLALVLGGGAFAQDRTTATIRVECSGNSNSQVAVRWGHPNYGTTGGQYLDPLFTTHCGTGIQTRSTPLAYRDGEFEIQTEGGIQTSYVVEATISRGSTVVGNATLRHTGSPDVTVRSPDVQLIRSSGPNKYGEQNFRVRLTAPAADAKVVASSSGGGGSQVALRWGHPDFHDNEYFPTWTVRSGETQTKSFHLGNAQSEFEIQTEGGEKTGYAFSIWLDQGKGKAMQPSIDIAHQLHGTNVSLSSRDGLKFEPTKGNAYGEMNVRVTIPWLPVETPPPMGMTTVRPGFSSVSFWNCRKAPVTVWAAVGSEPIQKVASLKAGGSGCGAGYPVDYSMPLKEGAVTSFRATMPSSPGCQVDSPEEGDCLVDTNINLLGRSGGPVYQQLL